MKAVSANLKIILSSFGYYSIFLLCAVLYRYANEIFCTKK